MTRFGLIFSLFDTGSLLLTVVNLEVFMCQGTHVHAVGLKTYDLSVKEELVFPLSQTHS